MSQCVELNCSYDWGIYDLIQWFFPINYYINTDLRIGNLEGLYYEYEISKERIKIPKRNGDIQPLPRIPMKSVGKKLPLMSNLINEAWHCCVRNHEIFHQVILETGFGNVKLPVEERKKLFAEQDNCIKIKNKNAFMIKIIWNQLMNEIEEFSYSPPIKKNGIAGYEYKLAKDHFDTVNKELQKK